MRQDARRGGSPRLGLVCTCRSVPLRTSHSGWFWDRSHVGGRRTDGSIWEKCVKQMWSRFLVSSACAPLELIIVVVRGVLQPSLIHIGSSERGIVRSGLIKWCGRGFVVSEGNVCGKTRSQEPKTRVTYRPWRTSDSMHSSGVSFVVRHLRNSAVASGDVEAARVS
jgi:hypothetical protein